ncbi:putative acid phosphatase 5 [Parasteatoda tepidariorum]|uniref:putative acid phosphatase 5 n=1 Tax=Parasteatoda tepidariorum TaxID=114398 RepID=UPI001C727203|nr:putative acid phosphatase 5 [Parasteatoda tepidariorum]
MYDYLEKYSGKPITGWKPAAFLRDNIWVEMRYNLTVPTWVEPYWNELTEVKDLAFFWILNSQLLQRLRAGPLLQNMIKTMEDKIEGIIPNLKFQIFSSHDTNLAALLMSLKLFDLKQPPYCATVFIELYSGMNDTYFVRLLYLNSTDVEKISQTPHILQLEGCSEFCPLKYFTEYTKHLIPDDWEKECQLPESNSQKFEKEEIRLGVVFLAIVFIIVTVSFAAAVSKMYSNNRKKNAFLISIPNS